MGTEQQEVGCQRGRVSFLDGRTARSPEERVRADREKDVYDRARVKRNHIKHMNLVHPHGLAEIKNPNGSIAQKGGARPWAE